MPENRIGLNSFAAFLDQISRHPDAPVAEIQLRSIKVAIAFAVKHNFDFVEILFDSPLLGDDVREGEMRDYLAEIGIPVNVHAPFIELSLCSHNTLVREASIQTLIDVIAKAEAIHASCVTFHPGPRNFPFYFIHGHYTSSLQDAIHRILDANTNSNIRLCLENMPTTERFFGRIEEFQRVLDLPDLHSLFLTYDTSHLFTWRQDPAEFWRLFHDRVGNIHLVDNRYYNQDPHVPLGKGLVDFQRIANLLVEYTYPYDIVVEMQTLHACDRGRSFFLEKLETARKVIPAQA